MKETESADLERHLAAGQLVATSRIAVVEVSRATAIANPGPKMRHETDRLLDHCTLVEIADGILRRAATLASTKIRALDAIHLASALEVEADEFLVYDRRLQAAADELGLRVASPGVPRGG